MQGVQVQLVMGELRTELGMQIQEIALIPSATELRILQRQDVCNAKLKEWMALDEEAVAVYCSDKTMLLMKIEAPTAHTMFMENLSSTDLIYDEAGLSYESYILSEVHNHDYYEDDVYEHYEAHEMHHDDNAEPVVQNNVSSMPNDAYMMIINEMHEQSAHSVSANKQNKVVNASLIAELATYKEQVELYERRAKFELTEREQKIEEQLRIVITDRNIKEENLKKELHSIKMQLTSTINHNKSMVEEVMSLKKDFKEKENKYLEEFLDMKALKEKVEDKLYKQDQSSSQTVHNEVNQSLI
ncbi:hypothetical protein Tco_0117443 [Tanacetum coccineum]